MLYQKTRIGNTDYELMNLDHKSVEKRIISDMDAGVDVYYDRRWEVTEHLTDWLEMHHEVYAEKTVLVLGAGVGAETLVLGRLAKKIYLNDLSPVALELCVEQLERNSVVTYETLLGRYEQLALPKVDLIIASFLVYNRETLTAIKSFIKDMQCQFILMNENLKEFQQLLAEFRHEVGFEVDGAKCVVIGSSDARA